MAEMVIMVVVVLTRQAGPVKVVTVVTMRMGQKDKVV